MVDPAQAQCFMLAGHPVVLIAEQLLDHRQIHKRRRVIGREDVFVEQLAAERTEIDAVESELRKRRCPERLIGWLPPEERAHAALTRRGDTAPGRLYTGSISSK